MTAELRALHELLLPAGQPAAVWSAIAERLLDCSAPLTATAVDEACDAVRVRISPRALITHLRGLEALTVAGTLLEEACKDITTALRLAESSFGEPLRVSDWYAVATLPEQIRTTLRPPAVAHTAGVLLTLVDRATRSVVIAAPYVDPAGFDYLLPSVFAALKRRVAITIFATDEGSAVWRTALSKAPHAAVQPIVVDSAASRLGSHAKVVVVDGESAYVGSANLTAAGLGRHIEIGVVVEGPDVEHLAALLSALARVGHLDAA